MQLDRVSQDEAPDIGDDSELESRFFSTPPASLAPQEIDSGGPWGPPSMPRTNQLVMVATVAMLATAAMVIPLTLIYSKALVGAGSMLSHEGPYLPDQAAYRTAMADTEADTTGTETGSTVVQPSVVAMPSNSGAAPAQAAQGQVANEPPAAASTVNLSGGSPAAPISSGDDTTATAAPTTEAEHGETQQPLASASPAAGAKGAATAPLPKKAAQRGHRRPRAGSVEHAFALFNSGKFQAAERAARRAANAHPTQADAWLILGAARDALGNRRGAIAAYNVCSARAQGPAAMDCQRLARGN